MDKKDREKRDKDRKKRDSEKKSHRFLEDSKENFMFIFEDEEGILYTDLKNTFELRNKSQPCSAFLNVL